MTHPPTPRAARAGILLVSAAVALSGPAVLTAGPALSATDKACPAPFPVKSLKEGQSVSGLTVSQGTKPESFSGKVVGVIDDGIAPGLPMILTRLTSSEVDRVGGIWAGMSGSPVYASDGRLIGAVSYGLSAGASPVAGVTPAADMQKLLRKARAPKGTVTIPRAIASRLVSSGAADRGAVASGMRRLSLPLAISGMTSEKRLRLAARRLHLDNVLVYRAGAARRSAPKVPIVPGGNLAAAASFGDVSAIGIGTATAVCGDQVIGFGHPAFFTGPSTLTMHGATALLIQEDTLGTPYKLANPGAPVGKITQDRLAGIVGTVGPLPRTVRVTSHVKSASGRARSGETDVSLQNSVPDLALLHLLTNQDRVKDGIGKGFSLATWTVSGKRANGTPFKYSRTDRFADRFDSSFATVVELANQLFTVQQNGFQDVTFTGIKINEVVGDRYSRLSVTKVARRTGGAWAPLSSGSTLRVRAGHSLTLRVTTTSNRGVHRTRLVRVPVPAHAAGKFGSLEVFGGNGFGEEAAPASFAQLLRRIRNAPRNDDLVIRIVMPGAGGGPTHGEARVELPSVVDGFFSASVRGVR